ncbi:SDR family NAD(P)-dependent oxidoreductase [Streptomyces sp. DSM 41987]|uniref:SDR family NAD(P)-dependent oxidoreductase n=1 Tax=Streptomyces TaxID=1883 RepID=UPI0018DF2F72|nr:SDR family oxidoreductase [Streptomyces fildesensis]
MGDLTGKTALVTGASRGIGRAIAQRLAADGALVAVHYGSNETAAKETVDGILTAGGRAFALEAELGVEGDVDTLVHALERGLREHTGQAPRLDILVNNAAINAAGGPIEAESPERFERLFAVNVRAPFFLVQRVLPLLRDGGRIINISSAVTRIALPETIAYGMTKGALDVLGHTLAKHLGPRNITVNTVAPATVDTDANAFWLRGNPEAQELVAADTALGRVGLPDDIAAPVAFLASDDARWITGQIVDATGGCRL